MSIDISYDVGPLGPVTDNDRTIKAMAGCVIIPLRSINVNNFTSSSFPNGLITSGIVCAWSPIGELSAGHVCLSV